MVESEIEEMAARDEKFSFNYTELYFLRVEMEVGFSGCFGNLWEDIFEVCESENCDTPLGIQLTPYY